MRPASNGLATTLLLLVPLVAVPFAAAIGLPQLSATPAGSTDEPDLRLIDPEATADAARAATERQNASAQPSADDLFAPLDLAAGAPQETSYEEAASADARAGDRRERVRSRLAALAAVGDNQASTGGDDAATLPRDAAPIPADSLADDAPLVRDDAFDAGSIAEAARGPEPRPQTELERGMHGPPEGPDALRTAGTPAPEHNLKESDSFFGEPLDEEPFRRDRFADNEPARAAELTWESAVQRMKELGIEDFALSPGDADRGFHFRCQLSDAVGSGTIHRFEAEAADPLAAVASAIEQVESWLQQTAASDPQLDGRLARLGHNLEAPTR